MKHSIQKEITVVLALELIAVIAACAIVTYRNFYSSALKTSRDDSRNAAKAAGTIISEYGLDAVTDPENKELYGKIRRRLRAICKAFELDYLYIYTIEGNDECHYIMAVASKDENDRIAAEWLKLGTVRDCHPLHAQEEAAVKGEISDELFILKNEFGRDMTWIVPFFDDNGKVRALIGADAPLSLYNAGITRHFFVTLIPISLLIFIAHMVLFFIIHRRIVTPVKTIANRMRTFDPSQKEEPLQINSQDEMRSIAEAFEKMSHDIHLYIENIANITAESEQAKAQLDVARKIQYGMVPASFDECRNGIEISALMQPAKEVGGDFYDAFALENGNYCAMIGDVSGKGVGGALFMALTKSILRDRMKQIMDPAAVLNKVNDDLCAQNPEGMFATVFVLVINPKTGVVTYANAGHNAPVLLAGENISFLDPEPGIALGLFEDAGIRNGNLTLKKGEGLLLYTDGVTEAVNSEKAFFGTEKLLSLLKEVSPKESSAAANSVKNSVEEFFTGCEQFDDITVLSLFYRGEEGELELKPSLDGFKTVRKSVLELCAGSGSAKKALLACEEAFVNIVSYSGASYIKFSCSAGGGVLTVTLKDNGISFDPFAGESSAEKDFESFDKGGMGISLIKQIAEKTEWKFENGNNILTLTFKI
jgi:sigma-B regulation protein RsbU (phosphoserine phosphatase)